MKGLLSTIIDKLQELFPPNRIAIILAGTITAVSGSIAAWLAAHFPGLNFGALEIAGVLTGAVLITVRLLDRWFDRWQEGERVDYQADVGMALEELADTPDAQRFFDSLGALHGFGDALEQLRTKLAAGSTMSLGEVVTELEHIGVAVDRYIIAHADQPPTPPVASPPAAAVPPAAPQPAE